jgi:hypothetical protein
MDSSKSFPCPVCGEDVPAGAKACPECGACEKSGWNEDEASHDGLDLPGQDFDYEKFKADEFGEPRNARGMPLAWKITAIVLLVVTGVLTLYDFLFR